MSVLIPKRMFFTKGIGYHRNKLQSFELALRDAGIEKCNLVYVSSILPPDCRIIPRSKGIAQLVAGQITFVVLSRESTDSRHRAGAAERQQTIRVYQRASCIRRNIETVC